VSPINIFTPIKNCSNGECEYGQRLELSPGDVKDIETLYRCGMEYDQCQDLWQNQNADVCELVDCNNLKARSLCSKTCSKKSGSFCQKLMINSTEYFKETLDFILGSYEYHSMSGNGKNVYKYIGKSDVFFHFDKSNHWRITNEANLNTSLSWIYNTDCTASYPERCSSINWKNYNATIDMVIEDSSFTITCETKSLSRACH